MRLILTILSLWFLNANATTYYVSNAGRDTANGLTTGTSWQTLTKVNATTFVIGDSILFKGGDTLVGTLRIKTVGIYVSSYGTGRAYISGLKQAALIQKGSTNIWAATITDAAANLNLVVMNDSTRIKARYPNNSYFRYNDTTSTSTVLQTSLSGTPDYTGFEIVVRDAMYIIDNRIVSSQSTGALTLNSATTNINIGGNGYFFQNDSTLLDSSYEWSKQGNRFLVYLPSSIPVYYSAFDTGIRIMHVRNVNVENINVIGFNKIGVQYDTSNASVLTNFNVNHIGMNGISAQKCDTLVITHGSIKNVLNNGALLRDAGGNHRQNLVQYLNWDYDTITNVGIYPGMGQSDNGTYMGIFLVGFNNKVQHSIFKNIGFNAMYIVGRFDSVQYNYFDSFCRVKNDGGAIYTWIDGNGVSTDAGSVWAHDWDSGMYWGYNIAVHGVGNQSGCNPNSIYYGAGASCFYSDLNANNIRLEYNTGGYGRSNILYLSSGAHNDTIRYNTFYNNQDRVRNLFGTHTTTYSTLINNNIYYLGDSSQPAIFDSYTGGNAAGLIQDSNYYTGIGIHNLYSQDFNIYSFGQYVAATGYDTHGGTNPAGARNRTAILIYNPTLHDSTFTLNDTYTDVYGTIYFTSVTLHAFESRILFSYTHQFTKSDHFLIPH